MKTYKGNAEDGYLVLYTQYLIEMTKTDSQNVYCRKRENEIVFERVTF